MFVYARCVGGGVYSRKLNQSGLLLALTYLWTLVCQAPLKLALSYWQCWLGARNYTLPFCSMLDLRETVKAVYVVIIAQINNTEALSQHGVDVHCLRSDLILAPGWATQACQTSFNPWEQCSFPVLISLIVNSVTV